MASSRAVVRYPDNQCAGSTGATNRTIVCMKNSEFHRGAGGDHTRFRGAWRFAATEHLGAGRRRSVVRAGGAAQGGARRSSVGPCASLARTSLASLVAAQKKQRSQGIARSALRCTLHLVACLLPGL